MKTAEKEEQAENEGSKLKADPVFFLSLVGVGPWGHVDEHEHIFDIYTRFYDFKSSGVHFQSAQDLWVFYKAGNKGSDKKDIDIYTLVQHFVKHHPDGNFVLDEVPFLANCKFKCYL